VTRRRSPGNVSYLGSSPVQIGLEITTTRWELVTDVKGGQVSEMLDANSRHRENEKNIELETGSKHSTHRSLRTDLTLTQGALIIKHDVPHDTLN